MTGARTEGRIPPAGSLRAFDRAALGSGAAGFGSFAVEADLTEDDRLALLDMLRREVVGALRLLVDDLGFRREVCVCGSRRGRGMAGDVGETDNADLLREPFEDIDVVRSRGKGMEDEDGLLGGGALRLLFDGIRRGAGVLRDSHCRPSSSLTGVNGIAMLESEAVDGVAKPASSRSCSPSCSRI